MMHHRPIRSGAILGALSYVACLAFLAGNAAGANERDIRLQGLFCNTQKQLDETLAYVDRGLSPEAATKFLNQKEVACNHINRLYYVVERPIKIGTHHGRFSVVKYEGILTGVVVGGLLRPIYPSVRIFFVTPEPLAARSVGRRS